MEDKNNKENIEEDRKSNSSVLNLSLESTKEVSKDSISSEYKSNLKRELMNEVNLPIENEINATDTTPFILEEKEKEKDLDLNNEFFFENKKIDKLNKKIMDNSFDDEKKHKKKYKHIKKEPLEYVSPLKLCRKTFGNISKWNKKPNEVFCDFQKNILDNKSCNDEDSQDDYYLPYSETERSTPNLEDLNNLLNCRKKMTLFKNSINDRTYKEYENLLNSDNIFLNKDNFKIKKCNLWNKHIKQILNNRSNNKLSNSFFSRISAGSIIDKSGKNKDGLFILGLLESVVNEKKRRYTTNV